MRHLSILLAFVLLVTNAFASYPGETPSYTTIKGGNLKLQTNTVSSENTNGNISLSPNGTGLVEVNSAFKVLSTTKGSQPCPVMTEAQRNAIAAPADGDCVYNSTSKKFNTYSSGSSSWIAGGGISNWVTGFAYQVDDVVIQSSKIYQCATAHTSGTFATDLSATKWVEISAASSVMTLKADAQAAVTPAEIQVPFEQVTQIATGKYRIETGNDNVVKNPGFEGSTLDVYAYDDAADTPSALSTAGTETTTCTASTSTALSGAKNLLITKTAGANYQGEGCALAFTIPASGKYKLHRVRFSYIESGTTAYADGYIRVWVIPSGGTPIEVNNSDNYIYANSNGGDFDGTFQATDATSYTLAWHIYDSSASAWNMRIDDLSIKRKDPSVKGAVVTDPVAYTPTLTSSGGGAITLNATSKVDPNGFCHLTGKFLNCEVSFRNGSGGAASGSAGTVLISLPSGYTIDPTSRPTSVAGVTSAGFGSAGVGASDKYTEVVPYTSDYTKVVMYRPTDVAHVTVADIGASKYVTLNFSVPVVGRSSNMTLSEDGGTRHVSTKAVLSGNQTVSATTLTKIQFNSVSGEGHDRTGSFDTTTNYRFTAPESGYYKGSMSLVISSYTANEDLDFFIYKNGSGGTLLSNNSNNTSKDYRYVNTSFSTYLTKGEYIEAFIDSVLDASYIIGSANSWISIAKDSSPQTLAGGETVAASYTSNSGQAIGTSPAALTFEDKENDTHNRMSGSTYTIPMSGKYDVSCSFMTASLTPSADSDQVAVFIYKNGSVVRHTHTKAGTTAATTFFSGTALLKNHHFSQGETVDCRGLSTTATTMNTVTGYNKFTILRVGN